MNGHQEVYPRCATCQKPAAQVCGGCKKEYYCGKVHQKQAWRSGHKTSCSSFKLEFNEILGRHLVATRDIKQGEMIIREKPAIVGPKMLCYPTCLTCYKRIEPAKLPNGKVEYPKCIKCGWPMCNMACQSSDVHKEECELMVKRKFYSAISYKGEERKESAYCVITPLRCLLLQKSDPKQYEAIINCEHHLEERIDTPLYRILKANLITFIHQVLGLVQFDEETILKMCAIFDTNAFDMKYCGEKKKSRGLYLTASMLAHDCRPNTKHVFKEENYCMEVIATSNIPKGSILTTTYTQLLWGTLARRTHLSSVKCFDCICDRCKDPTELGTYMGSIFCSQCMKANGKIDSHDMPKMISTNPLNDNAKFKCEKCNHMVTVKQMICGNESVRKEVEKLDKKNPKELESFLFKYKQALHPTNYHLLIIKYLLTQLYGNLPGYTYNEMNDAMLNRKISLCEEMLDIIGTIQPGWFRERGSLLMDLQSAMVVKAKRDLIADKITKSAAQDLMAECMEMLKEAYEILKCEEDMKDIIQTRLQQLAAEIED